MAFISFLRNFANSMNKNDSIIGFDAKRIVRNGTGLGSYGRTLVNSLALAMPDTSLLLYAPDEGNVDLRKQVSTLPNLRFVYPNGKVYHLPVISRLMRDWWRTKGVVDDLKRDGVRLFHGLSGELPKGLRKNGIQGMMTVHDLIFLRHPEFYNPIDVFLYKRKFYASLAEADRIMAISECTKRDILAYSNYPQDRISVIYQSCGTRFKTVACQQKKDEVRNHYLLPDHYILSVGTIEERKNALLVVKALTCDALRNENLVLVGRQTDYARRVVIPFIHKMNLEKRVHILQGVPNDDLPAIYQMATCFVYPSRYEGFGIPVIEAVQSGLPVVAATGSCLEEAGGPDGIYVDPDDHEALAAAVIKAVEEAVPRVERSMEYIRRFEQAETSKCVIEEYNRLLVGR